MVNTEYVLGYSETERIRLVRQADQLREEAVALLDQIGVRPGWDAIDVGCGPIGILDLLAERVGQGGSVIGLDREAQTIAMAGALVAERGLDNVQLLQGDAGATDLPRAAFDLAHARLLLITVPDPERILAEMVALARPGGIVAVQDIDGTAQYCEPPHPAHDSLLDAVLALRQELGQDTRIGRRLFSLLRGAGLDEIEVAVRVQVGRAGEFGQTVLLDIVRSVGPKIVARGLLTEGELVAQVAALAAHLADPGTITVSSPLFQAWGRRPG